MSVHGEVMSGQSSIIDEDVVRKVDEKISQK